MRDGGGGNIEILTMVNGERYMRRADIPQGNIEN